MQLAYGDQSAMDAVTTHPTNVARTAVLAHSTCVYMWHLRGCINAAPAAAKCQPMRSLLTSNQGR
jgi:hypothetical protein